MAYASLPSFVSVPEDLDVCQTSILQNLDDASVKSLNGCRVADQLLRGSDARQRPKPVGNYCLPWHGLPKRAAKSNAKNEKTRTRLDQIR